MHSIQFSRSVHSFDFQALFCCASVKVLDNCNSAGPFCQGLFSCFENFFSLYLKVIQLLSADILQSQSLSEKTYFITFALGVAFKIPLCYYSFAGREKYPRGRRGGFAKALGRATGAGVRIPPSPPKTSQTHCLRGFFICLRLNLLLFAIVITLYTRKQYAS